LLLCSPTMQPREHDVLPKKSTEVLEQPKVARRSRRVNDTLVLVDMRQSPRDYFGGVVPVTDEAAIPVMSCDGVRLPINMLMRHSVPARVSTSA